MKFAVITEVPDRDGPDAWQNLALPMGGAWLQQGLDPERVQPVPALLLLSLRMPVFCKGEILMLEGGREVNGHGRAPGKWGVACEEFDTIEAAVVRAKELS